VDVEADLLEVYGDDGLLRFYNKNESGEKRTAWAFRDWLYFEVLEGEGEE